MEKGRRGGGHGGAVRDGDDSGREKQQEMQLKTAVAALQQVSTSAVASKRATGCKKK